MAASAADIFLGRAPWPTPIADTGFAVRAKPGQVAIWSFQGPSDFLLLELGPMAPTVTQDTGWETVPRPKKRSLVEWAGHDPLRVTFDVMIDAFSRPGGGRLVERACRMLEKFAGAKHGAPPRIGFDARGVIPYDATKAPGAEWVIEDLEWGDSYRNRHGQRERQFAVLTMLQFVEDEELLGLPAVMKAAVKNAGKRFTEARAGESLRDIAKRTKTKLADLKRLNDIRDGDKTLKTGRRIRIK